jgi:hypothetical protein
MTVLFWQASFWLFVLLFWIGCSCRSGLVTSVPRSFQLSHLSLASGSANAKGSLVPFYVLIASEDHCKETPLWLHCMYIRTGGPTQRSILFLPVPLGWLDYLAMVTLTYSWLPLGVHLAAPFLDL